MAYTTKKTYKSRRERNKLAKRRMKAAFIIGILFVLGIIWMNRIYLWDVIRTRFY